MCGDDGQLPEGAQAVPGDCGPGENGRLVFRCKESVDKWPTSRRKKTVISVSSNPEIHRKMSVF